MNKTLATLVKRDVKIFYRTKGNIFFASLSVLILVLLHIIIFRDMFTDAWVEITAHFSAVPERESLAWIVDCSMFAAILPIGAITVSLVALGLMVQDRETNALSDFMVSPIKRNSLLASYLISSLIVGFIILMLFILMFEIYFLIVYGVGLTLIQFALITGTIILSLVFGNVFMLLIISFVKSQQSLGALGTIIGTMLGFLSGAYIPVGQFGEVVASVFSALPFLQITVLMRQAFLYEMQNVTGITLDMLPEQVTREMGFEVWLGSAHIPVWAVALIVGGVTLAMLFAVAIRFDKMKKAE